MARRYNRDSRGRFSGGGGGSKRPAARGISRGTNRLTRDNSGRITSVGGDGATARGGRLRTASGKQRARVTANVGAADRMSSTPKGTIGKTRKQREITMIDRPQAKRAAYNAGRAQQQAAIASRLAKPTKRRIKAEAPSNTIANKTGQSKTLNKFNSRPVGTMVAGRGVNLVPSTTRVPLRIQSKESDAAFAKMATKAARTRATIPAKAQQKQTTAQRSARAAANQKQVVSAIQSKGGKRPTPSRKQRRSIMTAESAKRFYSTNAVDTQRVNTKKPGFRLPRNERPTTNPTTRAAAAAAKPVRRNAKLGFTESDFARRSQRTASIRNPEVKAKAQRLYGRVMDTGQTPRQLRSMFKKAGKPKAKTATAAARRMQREHRDMMAASRVLFR